MIAQHDLQVPDSLLLLIAGYGLDRVVYVAGDVAPDRLGGGVDEEDEDRLPVALEIDGDEQEDGADEEERDIGRVMQDVFEALDEALDDTFHIDRL